MGYFKIKVTNKMVKILKEALPKDYEVKLVKLSPDKYKWYVHYEGLHHAEDYGDYDYKDNTCKAIRIVYPADYYACDNFITTKELIDAYKDIEGDKNIDNYKKALFRALEV